MAPAQDPLKRVGRKLTKRRRPLRNPTVQYPERLKEGGDVHEDVTATDGKPSQNLNQSVFSMIAAAGSKVDFHARFEDDSTDSEEEDPSKAVHDAQGPVDSEQDAAPTVRQDRGTAHQQSSGNGTVRSLPKLNLRTIKEKNYMSQSNHIDSTNPLSPTSGSFSVTPRNAPVMSMMLQAQAQLDISKEGLDPPRELAETSQHPSQQTGLSDLVIRLKEIFGFDKPEEVISGNYRALKL